MRVFCGCVEAKRGGLYLLGLGEEIVEKVDLAVFYAEEALTQRVCGVIVSHKVDL